ncbi:hypothetical protein Pla175_38380 [Pirellulimonas nuda]|uniref:Acetyl xylan esterase (AXE1) n=1 Tax=Pirellulimonas nuda TaxID=2528009 RepID=A0A518DG32_9BACT|nr:alpha/beta hydrolase family protein [Pirellulimonas nuda]QDU90434.1 hypothetical protein Pla175_38380 [Pirellulimonas nuda]
MVTAQPADARLGPLVHLRQHEFLFDPPASVLEWQERADQVRRRVKVAAGLWPAPPHKTPNAVVHGRVDRDAYTVEKVYLESYPGHFVTGNLYRPKGAEGQRPGVLCPYGHWPGGRFQSWDDDELERQLASGAERYEVGGRRPIQARCVQLARMGCVVFVYDMLGYGDSQQIAFASVHQPSQDTIVDSPTNWGFYSTQAELRMQSPLGVQTFNSQCALDWLASLPDVDPKRIGVTGGSSGATQTLMLGAVDPRPAVSFPVVMVSTAMQGGCGCENACGLRVGTGNVELAALFAPKPLGMASADDWTRECITKGFPELQRLYTLLGKPDRVMLASLTQFPHNYNYASRAAMYPWMNRWLKIGAPEPIVERDFVPLSDAQMHVWDAEHPAPPAGPEVEQELLRTIDAISQEQLASLAPHDSAGLAEFRRVVGGAFEVLLAWEKPKATQIEFQEAQSANHPDYRQRTGAVRSNLNGARLSTVVLEPKDSHGDVVLWVHSDGEQGIRDGAGGLLPGVQRLLDCGVAVVAADLLYQGEPLTETRMVDERWPVAPLTYGYNRTVLAQRASDVLTLAAAARKLYAPGAKVHVISTGGSAPYVAAAGAIGGDLIDSIAIDTQGFRFVDLRSWRDPQFLPGAVKYGDLPALLALGAPRRLLLGGEGAEAPPLVRDAYSATNAQAEVSMLDGDAFSTGAAAWLLETHP